MAASGSRPSAPSLATLPDDLLLACFEQLQDPLERRRLLPAVCSRWQRLADDPQFVRSFKVQLNTFTDAFSRLAAFRGWVERSGAGAAVRSLRLVAGPFAAGDSDSDSNDWPEPEQLCSELSRIAAACAGLQQLRVETEHTPLPDIELSSLAAALPRLRLLHLHVQDTRISVDAPVGSSSDLLDLRLVGHIWTLAPGASLPPALTRLDLTSCTAEQGDFPAQIGLLTKLEQLTLAAFQWDPTLFGVLSRLGRLTALELWAFLRLPPPEVLRSLTNLRALRLLDPEEYLDPDEVDAALRSLPQLTALHLSLARPFPLGVAGLPQLQRFVWREHNRFAAPFQALPGGPWLASLRRLTLLGRVSARTIQVLQAATQLEYLGISETASTDPGEVTRLLRFASEHLTLQWLQLSAASGVSAEQAAAAVQSAPHLSISFVDHCDDLAHAVVPMFADD